MSLPNRTDLRNALVSDLKTLSYKVAGPLDLHGDPTTITLTPLADETGSVAHVFGYLNEKPNGITPFACVDAGAIQYNTTGSDERLTPIMVVIGFWAARGAADEHEVVLDNLALALALLLREKYMAKFASPSTTDYEVIKGTPYKFELHFVEFEL